MSIITGRRLNYFRKKLDTVFASKSKYGDSFVSVGRKSGTKIGDNSAVLGGYDNIASGHESVVLGGCRNTVKNMDSGIVGGYDNVIESGNSFIGGAVESVIDESAIDSVILGGSSNSISDGASAILGGSQNLVFGWNSAILAGQGCLAGQYQLVSGHYNSSSAGTSSGTGTETALSIGNGTFSTRSNAMRVDYNGKLWCKSAYSATGADYAELFEWLDENPNNEVRYGYFVTMVGNKIKKANSGDWILGIVSANPCILGNTDMEWQGQFIKDEFGAFIMEDIVVTEKRLQPKLDENGKQVYKQVSVTDAAGNPLFDKKGQPAYTEKPVLEEVEVEVSGQFYKVNPDYDPDQEYIDRISRPEWDAIGMMGVLSVYDDGSCQVDGYCTVTDGGIATASSYGYRVIERVTKNIVKVIINAESSNMVLAFMNRINLLEQQIKELSA